MIGAVFGARGLHAAGPRPTSVVAPSSVPAPTVAPPTTDRSTAKAAPPARRVYPVSTTRVLVGGSPEGDGTAASLPTEVWFPAASPGSSHVSHAGAPFPLVVFSQGFGLAPQAYSVLLRRWASAGYVVAAPAYPLVTQQLDEWQIVQHPTELRTVIGTLLASARRTGSVLDGAINESAVGIAGHSDGGDVTFAVEAGTCCHDNRVKAAIVMSGAEQGSFGGTYSLGTAPTLVIQGTADTINPPACGEQVYNTQRGPKWYLSLLGAGHLTPYLRPGKDRRVIEGATVDFWNATLKHSVAPSSLKRVGSLSGATSLTSPPSVPQPTPCPGAPVP